MHDSCDVLSKQYIYYSDTPLKSESKPDGCTTDILMRCDNSREAAEISVFIRRFTLLSRGLLALRTTGWSSGVHGKIST